MCGCGQILRTLEKLSQHKECFSSLPVCGPIPGPQLWPGPAEPADGGGRMFESVEGSELPVLHAPFVSYQSAGQGEMEASGQHSSTAFPFLYTS